MVCYNFWKQWDIAYLHSVQKVSRVLSQKTIYPLVFLNENLELSFIPGTENNQKIISSTMNSAKKILEDVKYLPTIFNFTV